MPLLTCQDASFAYDGKVAVRELNFTVESGDYLCVVGENGSGKSTLIKGLLQLMSPKEGSVLMGEGLRLSEIGYLPQQTAAQKDFPASAYEVVLSGCLGSRGWLPFYSSADRAVVEQNMKRFNIDYLRDRCYRELSGGQQQRVLLARALCATKRVLLLDEPVAGLDPLATHELYRLIESMNRELGLTIIMVSHDIHCAVEYASHILHLANRQMFFGRTEDYIHSDVGRTFLDDVVGELDAVVGEKTYVAGEPDALAGEKTAVAGEPDALAGEKTAVAGEPDAVAGEPDALAGEPDALAGEKTA